MAVLARDAVASDQLVYAWPFPIGPEAVEVSCGEDEIVVMCPAWAVGDRLGPGRHHWRTPDPAKPTNAYFVLVAPVEVPFDMMTTFMVPSTHQPVRVRAQGSMLAQCIDPALLIAQFVGLPFDNVNDGVVRSVASSVERLLARVLVRRVLAAGSPVAATDPGMLPSIVDEMTAYNPAAGAVTGVAFVRFNQLVIQADDGGMGGQQLWNAHPGWDSSNPMHAPHPVGAAYTTGAFVADQYQTGPIGEGVYSGEIQQPAYQTGAFAPAYPPNGFAEGSTPPSPPSEPLQAITPGSAGGTVSGEIGVVSGEIGASRRRSMPPGVASVAVAPEVGGVYAPGSRVLVSGPDGLLHASTVRQHSQGYYEVEIGSTGQAVWVPASAVIPEQ